MFLSVVILGRFTTETHAMALLRQGPTRRHHLHHSPGRSPATILTKLGARVTALDVRPTEASVDRALEVDLRDRTSIERAAESIDGPVHGYFGCAGLPGPPFSGLDVLLVNFVGARHLVDLVLPKIPAGGAIAVVASNAAMGWQKELEQLMELVSTDGFDEGGLPPVWLTPDL
ncbi:hypothetical protein MINTM007_13180 [Mycobacterium intracellulare]|nr:hypothetical protein MINTM007_13180 [Mycobacterium intracellulare]